MGDQKIRLSSKFRNKIQQALNEVPIESGIKHPAETILTDFFAADALNAVANLHIIAKQSVESHRDILRLAGRVSFPGLLKFFKDALTSEHILVRDAAVRALEALDTEAAINILINHSYLESERWLADYCKAIINNYRNVK